MIFIVGVITCPLRACFVWVVFLGTWGFSVLLTCPARAFAVWGCFCFAVFRFVQICFVGFVNGVGVDGLVK